MAKGWKPRRRRWVILLTLIVFAGLALRFVPMFPHVPTCDENWTYPGRAQHKPTPDWLSFGTWELEITGTMSERYLAAFSESLEVRGVEFVRIGNQVLFRYAQLREGPYDDIFNAHFKTVGYLGSLEFGPYRHSMPSWLERKVSKLFTPWDAFKDCVIVRALTIENWGRWGTEGPGP